ncbi:MAG: UDP-N-acetylmuramoyl-L-alanine--D-glutamate ligase [bacterium]|nr:UDP-N-acetylmuramoyl-L-alanine--D-glutamate ligase [bacterium]
MTLDELKNKKIVVVGLGVNNKYLATYLKNKGVFFEVIESWNSFDELNNKLKSFEVIFRTPGLPFMSEPVQQALKAGVEVNSQTKLFFDLCPCPIIGVTGTKGKGTVSSLIYRIIEKSGKKKVWLAGNIGHDPFEFLDQIKPNDLVILELSSFQLQDLHKSPQIAVVLNVSEDHIDKSKTKQRATHYSFEEYSDAKMQIIKYQTEHDFALLGPDVPKSYKDSGLGKKIFIDDKKAHWLDAKLLGKHNLFNIAAAAEVANLLGIDEKSIKDAVSEFEGLPFRMQDLGEIKSVRVINDGFSTNPQATIAAISAFSTPVILIIGGFDKGFDYIDLTDVIKKTKYIKGVVVTGEVTSQILEKLEGYRGQIKNGAKDIKEIVDQAFVLAKPRDTIIFSPGTSSFDMFKNETDRAEKFTRTVKNL